MHVDLETPLLIWFFSSALRMTASEKWLVGNALLEIILIVILPSLPLPPSLPSSSFLASLPLLSVSLFPSPSSLSNTDLFFLPAPSVFFFFNQSSSCSPASPAQGISKSLQSSGPSNSWYHIYGKPIIERMGRITTVMHTIRTWRKRLSFKFKKTLSTLLLK